jgi:hypothetical protein
MSTTELKLAGAMMMGLAICGCDDDDDDDDIDAAVVIDAATVRDAATPRDADLGADAREAFASTLPLTTEQEVPVCDAAGADAEGAGMVTIDAANTRVDVVNLTYDDLSGPATAAHIHAGAPGVAGPIVLDFGTDLSSPINRTFTAADYPSPPPEGAPADFASFLEAMRNGQSYVNVHTAACPTGEIRGQIVE